VGKLQDASVDGDNMDVRFTITKTTCMDVPVLIKLMGRAVLTQMIDEARRKDAHTNLQSETDVEKDEDWMIKRKYYNKNHTG
jgi:hypothetical protein